MSPTRLEPQTTARQTGEQPALHESTPVPLKWLLAGILAAFASGGGYALGQARMEVAEVKSSVVEARVVRVEGRVDRVEEAIVTLKEIAAELKGRSKP